LVAGLILMVPAVAWGSQIPPPFVVFGDSLSDAGDVSTLTGNRFPPAPYVNGRFSNGPVWVEQLANKLGVSAPMASLNGGSDYAYGFAQTGNGYTTPPQLGGLRVPNVSQQINQYLVHNHPTANQMFVIWAGANDFFDGQRNPAVPAKNIEAEIHTLIHFGAKNFLVANLPDLSQTPFGLSSSPATQQGLHALTVGFNQALSAELSLLTSTPGVKIHTLDTFGLFQKIQSDPSEFGFTNVSNEGILTGTTSANGFLFWDQVHPTTAGHERLAAAAESALGVPEPSSLTLLGFGLLGLGGFSFRRRSRTRSGRPQVA
jgi:phospholipase/lecithinase/hemolysin